jgi:Skp family chaperone for outer membrane proteins
MTHKTPYGRRKGDILGEQNNEVMGLFEAFAHEARKDRESFRKELKDLAEHTDHKIEAVARDTSAKIEKLSDTISYKLDQIRLQQKTDPKMWLQFGSLLATFAAMAGALIVMHQKGAFGPLEAKINYTAEAIHRHAAIDGHPEALIKHAQHMERFDRIFDSIDHIDGQIESMDEMIQREMRLLDATLQREIKTENDRTKARLDRLERKTGITP